jgi:hypothetical protein
VVCTHATDRFWRFATVKTPRSGEHGVSGFREFGFRQTEKGLLFLTRAADRITTAPPIADLIAAWGAKKLFVSFQEKVAKFINENSGDAKVLTPVIQQMSWTPVKIMYHLEKPQSQLI